MKRSGPNQSNGPNKRFEMSPTHRYHLQQYQQLQTNLTTTAIGGNRHFYPTYNQANPYFFNMASSNNMLNTIGLWQYNDLSTVSSECTTPQPSPPVPPLPNSPPVLPPPLPPPIIGSQEQAGFNGSGSSTPGGSNNCSSSRGRQRSWRLNNSQRQDNSVFKWSLSSSDSSTAASTSTNSFDADDKTTLVNCKGKRKPMSNRYSRGKDWNREDAVRALALEKEYSTDSKQNMLILRFPDPELSTKIIRQYSSDIQSVHFQQPCTPRFCFVQLKEGADVEKVKKTLSEIQFGTGFITAESKNSSNSDDGQIVETDPEEIDPYTLYIGNLSPKTSSHAVKQYFPGAHRVDIGFAQRMKYTRYAFIRYKTVDEAMDAYRRTVNTVFDSRSLIVRFRREKGNIGLPGDNISEVNGYKEPKDTESFKRIVIENNKEKVEAVSIHKKDVDPITKITKTKAFAGEDKQNNTVSENNEVKFKDNDTEKSETETTEDVPPNAEDRTNKNLNDAPVSNKERKNVELENPIESENLISKIENKTTQNSIHSVNRLVEKSSTKLITLNERLEKADLSSEELTETHLGKKAALETESNGNANASTKIENNVKSNTSKKLQVSEIIEKTENLETSSMTQGADINTNKFSNKTHDNIFELSASTKITPTNTIENIRSKEKHSNSIENDVCNLLNKATVQESSTRENDKDIDIHAMINGVVKPSLLRYIENDIDFSSKENIARYTSDKSENHLMYQRLLNDRSPSPLFPNKDNLETTPVAIKTEPKSPEIVIDSDSDNEDYHSSSKQPNKIIKNQEPSDDSSDYNCDTDSDILDQSDLVQSEKALENRYDCLLSMQSTRTNGFQSNQKSKIPPPTETDEQSIKSEPSCISMESFDEDSLIALRSLSAIEDSWMFSKSHDLHRYRRKNKVLKDDCKDNVNKFLISNEMKRKSELCNIPQTNLFQNYDDDDDEEDIYDLINESF